MNTSENKYRSIFCLIAFLIITSNLIQAQEFNLINAESSLKVFGTSSLHDWHIEAEEQRGTIVFKNVDACEIEKCSIEITAGSLKSGKKSMDKNTYKALNIDDYSTISFQLTEVKEIEKKASGKFTVKTLGDLTIVGVKKRVSLNFSISVEGNKIIMTGEKTFKMTDFKIDPPTALFGTITTGDEVTIKFSTLLK